MTVVKKECRAFASVLVASLKERLKNIWNYIQALELIDPLGPSIDRYATTDVWNALADLCKRRGIDFDKAQEQILQVRSNACNLDDQSVALIRTGALCDYLRNRHAHYVNTSTPSATP